MSLRHDQKVIVAHDDRDIGIAGFVFDDDVVAIGADRGNARKKTLGGRF